MRKLVEPERKLSELESAESARDSASAREASNLGDRVVVLEAEKAQLLSQVESASAAVSPHLHELWVHVEAQRDIYKILWEADNVSEPGQRHERLVSIAATTLRHRRLERMLMLRRNFLEMMMSGTIKLLASPVIEEYQSEIITEGTQSVIEERQVYQDKQPIATAMKHYSVMHKYQFRVKRSSHKSYWLICIGKNCNWHFKATSINDSAMFKCKCIAVVVGSMIIPMYCDPKTVYTPKDMQTDILSQHGVNLSYVQAWRAKEKALQFLRGHPADSYSKLPKYFYILEKTYPDSVVKLKKTADECFLYAFVALCTSISNWKYCTPVVVVDGTFLKSAYRGIMLTASTIDAAGKILSLAYAVVDSENDASWKYFFEQFKQAYGERTSMCIILDRNESILKATLIVYPGVPHYSCMWHIWTNIRAEFKKGHLQLNELYFATTRSYTLDEFN
ncbi:uncharacterized protein [Nicotiana sylvestris]|uniref:uncharacterized protein n=1 Tax=Nicotiana sylvestris TaxID=4096 RepID=UPI00388CD431